jgi:hypothetical protein
MLRKVLGWGGLVAVAGALLTMAPAGGAERSGGPVVTGAVQVTENPVPVRNYSSPLIARNPKTGELVTAEVDTRGSRECTVHISTNDGRSWKPGGSPMVKPFTDCSIGGEYGAYFNLFFDGKGVLICPSRPMTQR